MANRIVIQADIDTYASVFVGFPVPMQIGDVILNEPTSGPLADGKYQLSHASIGTTFSGARLGCNVWVDGTTLGTMYEWRFTNGGTGTEWAVSNITNPVTFMPIPNTQCKIWRNTSTNNGFSVLILDIKFWRIWGENDAFPGMRDGINGKHRGTYGIWISGDKDLNSAHAFSTNSLNGGSMEMIGLEMEHHFSGSRYTGGDYIRLVQPIQERCYIHDGITGEGNYWGATHGSPFAAIVAPIVKNCILTRRAAESIQIQHIVAGSVEGAITHNVVKDGAIDYIDAFQPYQDSGIQLSVEGGNTYFSNNIIDEAAAGNSMVPYSDNAYGHDGVAKTLYVNNNTITGGDVFLYIHNSCVHGMEWVFNGNSIGKFTTRYTEDSGTTVSNHAVGTNNGTDVFKFISNSFDTTKTNIFENKLGFHEIKNTATATIPSIDYANSGFLPGERPVKWSVTYGDYFPNPNGTFLTVYINRIYINIVDGTTGEYKFYKALTTHTASALRRPDLYPTGFKLLSWDLARIRCDQPGWNSADAQDYYPTDDLRVVDDNYYNKRRRGLLCNEKNSSYSQYQWYRSKLSNGSVRTKIPNGNKLTYTPFFGDKGYYIALEVKAKNTSGTWSTPTFSAWRLVS